MPAEEQAEQTTIKGELCSRWEASTGAYGAGNLSPETMRVNVQVQRDASDKAKAAYYVDTFDLYRTKQHMVYVK